MQIDARKDSKRLLVIIFASFVMALNIKIFVRTGGLFPGGATGLSILIQRSAEKFFGLSLPYSVINILLNSIPVYIGFRYIGKKFTLLSCLVIVLSSTLVDLIPAYTVTEDILLISIFGGIINGFCVSMCLLMDATTGGTDFIGIFLSQKKGMDSFNLILGINAVILSLSGILFGWDKALYSILYQYASTEIMHLMYRRYQQGTLFIVTTKPQEICDTIYKTAHHGATMLEGEGSHDHDHRKIIYSVVSISQARQVIHAVRAVDGHAFINLIRTQELYGRFYQPPKD